MTWRQLDEALDSIAGPRSTSGSSGLEDWRTYNWPSCNWSRRMASQMEQARVHQAMDAAAMKEEPGPRGMRQITRWLVAWSTRPNQWYGFHDRSYRYLCHIWRAAAALNILPSR